jgi:YceI-like domain
MSLLWTARRLPNLIAWGCCGLVVCVVGGEQPDPGLCDRLLSPTRQEPVKGKRTAENKTPAPTTPDVQRCFLGFELPAGSGAEPEARQCFEIVPDLSRVGVDMGTPVGGITAKSSCVGGSLVASPKRPESDATASLVVRTRSLSTGNRKHDAMIHDALQANTHTEIRLTLRSFTVVDRDVEAHRLTGIAECTLWICGHAHRLRIPVAVRQEQAPGHGWLLVVKGEAKLNLSKMGVEVPRTFGIPLIHDEITLWLGVRGRSTGPAPTHKEVARAR